MNSNYRVSDLIADFLCEIGSRHAFALSGGGNMYLIDALNKNKNIEIIPFHHEQTASIAAEAYSRVSEKLGVAVVTSGPGSTNAITGVVGAWIESSPMIVISGQVKTKDLMKNYKQRQNGVQEVNITEMIKKVTKFSITIKNKKNIIKILNKAYQLSITDRPGPVWIDIPLDIQGAVIKKPKKIFYPFKKKISKIKNEEISKFTKLLNKSERPIFLIGNGARLSKSKANFVKTLNNLKIPSLFTWNAMDFVEFNNNLNFGRPGNVALRSSNLIVQNSDLVIAVGCKLDNIITAYNPKNFAPGAKKVYVNIDKVAYKSLRVNIDLFINNDANNFFNKIKKLKINKKFTNWIKYCNQIKDRYKIENEKKFKEKGTIHHFQAVDILSKNIKKNKIIATGSSGLAIEQFYTFFKNKSGQRIFLTSGLGSMGYGIPASIGACFGVNKNSMFLIEGDGSFHMNIQDLAVISEYKLPIGIFIFNNNGYASIRNTQKNYFKSDFFGTGPEAKLFFPNLKKIASAYNVSYLKIKKVEDFKKLKNVNNLKKPKIFEIIVKQNEELSPKVSAIIKPGKPIISMPLEDMSPLLNIDELKNSMLRNLSPKSKSARKL